MAVGSERVSTNDRGLFSCTRPANAKSKETFAGREKIQDQKDFQSPFFTGSFLATSVLLLQ